MRTLITSLCLLAATLASPLGAQTVTPTPQRADSAALDSLRTELVRSRGFLRAAETQLSKTLDLLDSLRARVPAPHEPAPPDTVWLRDTVVVRDTVMVRDTVWIEVPVPVEPAPNPDEPEPEPEPVEPDPPSPADSIIAWSPIVEPSARYDTLAVGDTVRLTVVAAGVTAITPEGERITRAATWDEITSAGFRWIHSGVGERYNEAPDGTAVTFRSTGLYGSRITHVTLLSSEGRNLWRLVVTNVEGDGSPLPPVDPEPEPEPEPNEPDARALWLSPAEIAALPTSGAAWTALQAAADDDCGTPDLSDQSDKANVCVLAKALVYARTGQASYRDGVIAAVRSIAQSGRYNGRALSLGRELAAYVISADLVDLKTANPALDQQFRARLVYLREVDTSGAADDLVDCHEKRPNNWGTMCGASRVAIAAYLGERAELDRAAQVFRGYLGERDAYAGFSYGELSWQCDQSKPVGINPRGCTKGGLSIDGVLPDDQRRGGGFDERVLRENYAYEALQGAVTQAWLLHRQGYDVWEWGDRALLRAFTWLHEVAEFPAEGDDTWQTHVVNHVYGTRFPAPTPARAGKIVGWTDWTHPRVAGGPSEVPGLETASGALVCARLISGASAAVDGDTIHVTQPGDTLWCIPPDWASVTSGDEWTARVYPAEPPYVREVP